MYSACVVVCSRQNITFAMRSLQQSNIIFGNADLGYGALETGSPHPGFSGRITASS